MAKSFGCDEHSAQDLVQDMYLRLHRYVENPERVMHGDEINTYFVFVVLRNLYITQAKASVIDYLEDMSDLDGSYSDADWESEGIFNELIDDIWKEVEKWHWYDTKMFKIYHKSPMTIKNISEETKISERSIWNTLDNGRKKIQINCRKAYQAWKTQEEKSGGW
jgi:DNA-directed RNA polymerase specialized sigma24 family protein